MPEKKPFNGRNQRNFTSWMKLSILSIEGVLRIAWRMVVGTSSRGLALSSPEDEKPEKNIQ